MGIVAWFRGIRETRRRRRFANAIHNFVKKSGARGGVIFFSIHDGITLDDIAWAEETYPKYHWVSVCDHNSVPALLFGAPGPQALWSCMKETVQSLLLDNNTEWCQATGRAITIVMPLVKVDLETKFGVKLT